ncbi:hypothetical protein BGX21_010826 [Mortierella sp. AD011]|nr:hypothetical protein BGX20_010642 [Mortierella sp. AD010]KAF9393281.1 hypothetical protein BGX21_010826 [Mortierella sp. AD011]
MTSNASATTRANDYFETGPNHVLCQVPGLDQDSFPAEFQHTWDLEHVRLPCADRTYPAEVNYWPEIVSGLTEPILTSVQLSEVMLRWCPGKRNGWNINALDAFLNNRSAEDDERIQQGTHSDVVLDPAEQKAQGELDSDDYGTNSDYDDGPSLQKGQDLVDPTESEEGIAASGGGAAGGPLKSQFLSTQERQHFFDVTLPRMQALALRLPELVKKPIPFLKMQKDSAVTLSQEQIACLLANAFFNTFPCRNTPYKRGRKKKPAFQRGNSGSNVNQSQQQQDDDDGSDDSEEEEDRKHQPKNNNSKSNKGGASGRGGHGGRGGRGGGGQAQQQGRGRRSIYAPRPPRKRRAQGPAAQFEFFDDVDQDLSTNVDKLSLKDQEENVEASSSGVLKKEDEWVPKMPSINFISLFWSEENKTPCTPTQAAKLRCILHYFDRVTTEMPQGTVTYHRQVLKKPTYLNPGEMLKEGEFYLSKVTVDSFTPIEEAPQGALQLDFANKNIGGGTLDKGAVQEEIRFMICPELIISRLFCQQLEANEAILIKGAERYSNYIGYSKTFEWFSDHQDLTPRDKLGRRMTEICAIDARPFKSRISRLEQFERHYVLREINKALSGYRVSPINASEWGLARKDRNNGESSLAANNGNRPIATGNWGCGAFGGHLQLKFVLQWLAASMCTGFSHERVGDRLGDDLLYYTFGMHGLRGEIETFVKGVEAIGKPVDPKRVMESIIHYPRRNSAGEIQKFRERTLFEYLIEQPYRMCP